MRRLKIKSEDTRVKYIPRDELIQVMDNLCKSQKGTLVSTREEVIQYEFPREDKTFLVVLSDKDSTFELKYKWIEYECDEGNIWEIPILREEGDIISFSFWNKEKTDLHRQITISLLLWKSAVSAYMLGMSFVLVESAYEKGGW